MACFCFGPLYSYVMDELGSALRHSDEPNFRVSPFLYMPEGKLASAVRCGSLLTFIVLSCFELVYTLFFLFSLEGPRITKLFVLNHVRKPLKGASKSEFICMINSNAYIKPVAEGIKACAEVPCILC